VCISEKIRLIKKLIVEPKKKPTSFWLQEMNHLEDLFRVYPCEVFWKKLSISKKLNSMKSIKHGYHMQILEGKYKEHQIKHPIDKVKSKKIKSGKDYIKQNKPKNIKEFLS